MSSVVVSFHGGSRCRILDQSSRLLARFRSPSQPPPIGMCSTFSSTLVFECRCSIYYKVLIHGLCFFYMIGNACVCRLVLALRQSLGVPRHARVRICACDGFRFTIHHYPQLFRKHQLHAHSLLRRCLFGFDCRFLPDYSNNTIYDRCDFCGSSCIPAVSQTQSETPTTKQTQTHIFATIKLVTDCFALRCGQL